MARRRFQWQGRQRAYQYGRMRISRGYARRGGWKGIAGVSLPYIGGAAAGYLAPRIHPMQDVVITALAVLPVRLPMRIKPIAQGYVLGMIARQFVPNVLGLTAATGGGDFA